MREIKFRAWNKIDRYMVNSRSGILSILKKLIGCKDTCYNQNEKDDNYILMQYVGLKDKNGKEIYDGDIIHHNNHTTHFDNDDYSYKIKVTYSTAKNYTGFNIKRKHCKQYTIIGNIYENPELLKEE